MGLVQTFCYPCSRLAVKEKVSKLIPNGPPLLDNAAHNNLINERIGIKYIKKNLIQKRHDSQKYTSGFF